MLLINANLGQPRYPGRLCTCPEENMRILRRRNAASCLKRTDASSDWRKITHQWRAEAIEMKKTLVASVGSRLAGINTPEKQPQQIW